MNNLTKELPIDLGDSRLNKRYKKVKEAGVKQPSRTLNALFKEWGQTQATYKLFNNPKVTSEKFISHEYRQTNSKIINFDEHTDILVSQDSSDLNYNGHESKEDLFPTHPHIQKGLKIHPSIAFTEDDICLGLLHVRIWTGKEKKQLNNQIPKSRPIEEKESYKWLESFKITKKTAQECPEKYFFNISDREGDIYDLLLEASKENVENLYFIIRSSSNRRTATKEGKLRETMDNTPEIGRISFEYKRKGEERTVRQTVKAKKIELKNPKNRRKKPKPDKILSAKVSKKAKIKQEKDNLNEDPKVKVWVVQAKEIDTPKGKKPINWTILTDYPIKSLEDAKKILHYYTKRWNIETFFKVLKSCCMVEKIRLQTLKRLTACLVLYMSIACRIMLLLKIGRTYPDIPCDIFFSPSEWKTVYMSIHRKKPPPKPPKLATIILYIAQLGGYLNRKNDPPPGLIVIWRGIEKMYTMVSIFDVFKIIEYE